MPLEKPIFLIIVTNPRSRGCHKWVGNPRLRAARSKAARHVAGVHVGLTEAVSGRLANRPVCLTFLRSVHRGRELGGWWGCDYGQRVSVSSRKPESEARRRPSETSAQDEACWPPSKRLRQRRVLWGVVSPRVLHHDCAGGRAHGTWGTLSPLQSVASLSPLTFALLRWGVRCIGVGPGGLI